MKYRNEDGSGETDGARESSWTSVGRRALLKIAGAASVGLPLAAYLGDRRGIRPANAEAGPRVRESYWRPGGHCVQETVDLASYENGVVRARIDGEWRDFLNRELPDEFLDWNIGHRLQVLRDPMGEMDCLAGSHSGCLATYGANRGDSVFTLNAAFKGFGFYPLESHILDVTQELLDTWDMGIMSKLGVLTDFYTDRTMWDFRLLSSLELYSNPDFETHSFLNQMANPVATINWLAIPGSFEVRAIARLLHPQDPDLTEMDFARVYWVNLMHDYFHSEGPAPAVDNLPYIACIYYVVECFDNSPYDGSPADGPMGLRVTPPR